MSHGLVSDSGLFPDFSEYIRMFTRKFVELKAFLSWTNRLCGSLDPYLKEDFDTKILIENVHHLCYVHVIM